MIDDRQKELFNLYIHELRKSGAECQDFAWDSIAEKNKAAQAEVCRYLFTTFDDIKVQNIGWGIRITIRK